MVSPRWYVDASRARIDWATAVVDAKATQAIYTLDVDGGTQRTTLWRAAGATVDARTVAYARATAALPDPPAPLASPEPGEAGADLRAGRDAAISGQWDFTQTPTIAGDAVAVAADLEARAAALLAEVQRLHKLTVRSVNGRTPAADGTLTPGAVADTLTEAAATTATGLLPGQIILNPGTRALDVIGPDGVLRGDTSAIFGDGSDGDVTIAATVDGNGAPVPTTLTRIMYYRNLTLAPGAVLLPAGFRIYVSGTLTLGAGASIHANGVGTTTGAVTPAYGVTTLGNLTGAGGGPGGTGGNAGGSNTATVAGGAGTPTTLATTGARQLLALLCAGTVAGLIGGVGGRGAGYSVSGGTTNSNLSASGTGGAGGGGLVIYARRVEGTGTIEASGADGVNGLHGTPGTNTDPYFGPNGGGGGGGGGAVLLFTHGGRQASVTVRARGGRGGLPGNPSGQVSSPAPVPALPGTDGNPGMVVEVSLFGVRP